MRFLKSDLFCKGITTYILLVLFSQFFLISSNSVSLTQGILALIGYLAASIVLFPLGYFIYLCIALQRDMFKVFALVPFIGLMGIFFTIVFGFIIAVIDAISDLVKGLLKEA